MKMTRIENHFLSETDNYREVRLIKILLFRYSICRQRFGLNNENNNLSLLQCLDNLFNKQCFEIKKIYIFHGIPAFLVCF